MVVRVRPLSDREIHEGHTGIVESDDLNCSVLVTNPAAQAGEPPKVFTFDSVFGYDSKQVRYVWHFSTLFVLCNRSFGQHLVRLYVDQPSLCSTTVW